MIKIFWVWEESSPETKIDTSSQGMQGEYSSDEIVWDEYIWQIALDVLENHESVCILAPVAWIQLSDIDISVHETTLSITGERNKPKEFLQNNMQVKNEECFWGKFKRSIILPDNMDFSGIKAVMENNLLVIHIPKIRFDSTHIKINRIHS